MNRTFKSVFFIFIAMVSTFLISSCSSLIAANQTVTGVQEIDTIIQIVLDGDLDTLKEKIQFTEVGCTNQEGLGGPPKCEDGEAEGTVVKVLPFLGPEGNFIRMESIDAWSGIDAAELYAVYAVSENAYSDPAYPKGKYAIAFINEAQFLITTLQITEGQIVRVDSSLGDPPTLRTDDVDHYLIDPKKNN